MPTIVGFGYKKIGGNDAQVVNSIFVPKPGGKDLSQTHQPQIISSHEAGQVRAEAASTFLGTIDTEIGVKVPETLSASLRVKLSKKEREYDLVCHFSVRQNFKRKFVVDDWALQEDLSRLTVQEFYNRFGCSYISEVSGVRTLDVFLHIEVNTKEQQAEVLASFSAAPTGVPVSLEGKVDVQLQTILSRHKTSMFTQCRGLRPELMNEADLTHVKIQNILNTDFTVMPGAEEVGIDDRSTKIVKYSELGINALVPYLLFDEYLNKVILGLENEHRSYFRHPINAAKSAITSVKGKSYSNALSLAHKKLNEIRFRSDAISGTEAELNVIKKSIDQVNLLQRASTYALTMVARRHSNTISYHAPLDPIGMFFSHRHADDRRSTDRFKFNFPLSCDGTKVFVVRKGSDHGVKSFKLKRYDAEAKMGSSIVPKFTLIPSPYAEDPGADTEIKHNIEFLREILKDYEDDTELYKHFEMAHIATDTDYREGEYYLKSLHQISTSKTCHLLFFCIQTPTEPRIPLDMYDESLAADLRGAATKLIVMPTVLVKAAALASASVARGVAAGAGAGSEPEAATVVDPELSDLEDKSLGGAGTGLRYSAPVPVPVPRARGGAGGTPTHDEDRASLLLAKRG